MVNKLALPSCVDDARRLD